MSNSRKQHALSTAPQTTAAIQQVLNELLTQHSENPEDHPITSSVLLALLGTETALEHFDLCCWEALEQALQQRHIDQSNIDDMLHQWLLRFALTDRLPEDLNTLPEEIEDKAQLQMQVLLYCLATQPTLPADPLLRLLSLTTFDVKALHTQNRQAFTALRVNLASAITSVPAFSKQDAHPDIKKHLLTNIIALEIRQALATKPVEVRHAVLKLNTSMDTFTEKQLMFLGHLAESILKKWSEQLTAITQTINETEDTRQKQKLQQQEKELANSAVSQVMDLLLAPAIFNNLIAYGQQKIAAVINQIIDKSKGVFYQTLFPALWDQRNNMSRTCEPNIRSWLFRHINALRETRYLIWSEQETDGETLLFDSCSSLSIHGEKAPSMLSTVTTSLKPEKKRSPAIVVDKESCTILKLISQSKDSAFIDELCQLQTQYPAGKSPLFFALTAHLGRLKNERSPAFYNDCQFLITIMLGHPAFNLDDYYEGASEEFKAMAIVKTAYQQGEAAQKIDCQLARLFDPNLTAEQLADKKYIKEKLYDNTAYFVQQLTERYAAQITALADNGLLPDEAPRSTKEVYLRLRKCNKIIKELTTTDALHKLITAAPNILKLFITYRIHKYQQTLNQRESLNTTKGKLVKYNFLCFLKDNLTNLMVRYSSPKQSEEPFLWPAFCAYQQSSTSEAKGKRYTPNDKVALENWLRDIILKSSTSSELAVTLNYFPDHLFNTLFAGTSITRQEVTNAAKGPQRRSSDFFETGSTKRSESFCSSISNTST